MLLGQFELNFTGQGRLILPKKIRENLSGSTLVLSRGLDGGIWGFDQKEWISESQKQLAQPLTEKEARDLRRYLFSAAQEVSLDEQGRFVIPKQLLDYAGLKNTVTLVGAGDHFEIWNNLKWKRIMKKIVAERGS